jgi:hypothetical protein
VLTANIATEAELHYLETLNSTNRVLKKALKKHSVTDKKKLEAIGHLCKADFQKIWKGKDWDFFNEFLRDQGVPAKGFLVSVEVWDGNLAWFFYPIGDVSFQDNKARIQFDSIQSAIPDENSRGVRECLEEWKGYPVWRL